jgi:hypothetical protein
MCARLGFTRASAIALRWTSHARALGFVSELYIIKEVTGWCSNSGRSLFITLSTLESKSHDKVKE